ncbi:MAG: hypothetical protein U0531_22430 [Dehalococcoidia bacterium]
MRHVPRRAAPLGTPRGAGTIRRTVRLPSGSSERVAIRPGHSRVISPRLVHPFRRYRRPRAAGARRRVAADRGRHPGRRATRSAGVEPRRIEPISAPDVGLFLDAPGAVAPGGRWALALRAAFAGGALTDGAAITLTLPTTVTLLGATSPFTAAAGRLTWRLPAAAGGTTATLTATLGVPPDAAPASRLRATAVVTARGDADGSNDGAAASARVVPADLRTSIATAARDVRPGEAVTWTVLAANVTDVAAEDVVVQLDLDPHTVFVTDTAGVDVTRRVGGTRVRWRWPALDGPTAAYIDVVTAVRLDVPAGAGIAPRVAITSATGISNAADDMAAAQPVPVVVPDLWLSALGPLTAARGGSASWQLRWGNRAGGRAKAIEVTATLPAGVTLLNTVPPRPWTGGGCAGRAAKRTPKARPRSRSCASKAGWTPTRRPGPDARRAHPRPWARRGAGRQRGARGDDRSAGRAGFDPHRGTRVRRRRRGEADRPARLRRRRRAGGGRHGQ